MMNKFDNTYNNIMSNTYSSMCLNEYQDTDDEDPKDAALAAADDATDGSDVNRAKEKHDRELEKVLDQKTKNLRKTASAIKRTGSA